MAGTTITLQRSRGDAAAGHSRSVVGASTGTIYIVDGVGRVTVAAADAGYLIAEGFVVYTPGSGFGSTPSSGVTTISFGAFPGSSSATTTIIAGAAADPNAAIDAWVTPIATADHSAEEHAGDPPLVVAAVVSGGNIVINGYPSGRDLFVPAQTPFVNTPSQMPIGMQQVMPYGAWSVAWAFAP
jgi:hypothetical protein